MAHMRLKFTDARDIIRLLVGISKTSKNVSWLGGLQEKDHVLEGF